MNESTKNILISLITSGLLSGSAATIGAALGLSHDQMVSFANAAAPVILAAIVGIGAIIYKAVPKSHASILKGASEVPGTEKIVNPKLADSPALKDNPIVVSKS